MIISPRLRAQVMVEENVLKMVPNRLAYEHMSGNQGFFEDKYVFYRFCFDFDAQCEDNNLPGDQQTVDNFNFPMNETNSISIERAESEILHCLTLLSKLSPGSMFRKILQKRPEESECAISLRFFSSPIILGEHDRRKPYTCLPRPVRIGRNTLLTVLLVSLDQEPPTKSTSSTCSSCMSSR